MLQSISKIKKNIKTERIVISYAISCNQSSTLKKLKFDTIGTKLTNTSQQNSNFCNNSHSAWDFVLRLYFYSMSGI